MAFSFPQQQQPSLFQTPQQQQQQQQQPSLFQTPQQQQKPFQFQPTPTPNPFQPQQQQTPQQPLFQFQPQQPSLFQTPQQQQQQQLFQQQQQQQQQQAQQQQKQILLYTVDKSPASYGTKWADLHPDSQKYLLMIEEKILEYRTESHALDQCSRLYSSPIPNCGFEIDANRILQELGGIATSMDREKVSIQERMPAINAMMRDTEIAVRSFMFLHQRFLHTSVANNPSPISGNQPIGTATASAPNTQSDASSLPAFDFYSGLPRRPSPFMQNTVTRFEKYLAECLQWIGELEQMLNLISHGKINTMVSSLQSLPNVIMNVHDYFVHVAAKVENLHQRVESMKAAYLADKRRGGDLNDPFLEADRREIAKQEAAARRVHSTLLSTTVSQPTTQSASLAPSSTIAGFASVPQLTPGTSGASSASGFSVSSNPSSSAQTSMFSTSFFSASAPSLFGSSGSLPLSTPSTTASTPMFGSSQPSPLFGSNTSSFPSPAFGSSAVPATPFGPGSAPASGFQFGGSTATKPTKPKARNNRR